jgi:hypothetical protein
MERTGLFALILSLVVSATPAAAQDWAQPAAGPITRSLAAEAAKLASIHPDAKADDVARAHLQKLDRGKEIAVLDKAGHVVQGHFAEADDDSLLLRDGALINRINRAEVLEIATVGSGKGSASAAAGFAMAGAIAAFLLDVRLAFSPCYGSCAGNLAMMVGVSAGLPLAGGFGGYYGFREPVRRVIYHGASTD